MASAPTVASDNIQHAQSLQHHLTLESQARPLRTHSARTSGDRVRQVLINRIRRRCIRVDDVPYRSSTDNAIKSLVGLRVLQHSELAYRPTVLGACLGYKIVSGFGNVYRGYESKPSLRGPVPIVIKRFSLGWLPLPVPRYVFEFYLSTRKESTSGKIM